MNDPKIHGGPPLVRPHSTAISRPGDKQMQDLKAQLKTRVKRIVPTFLIHTARNQVVFCNRWFRYPKIVGDFWRFNAMSGGSHRFCSRITDFDPHVGENTATTQFDHHYVYHPAWAARILRQTCPVEHVDISSSLSFCTLVSAFVPMRFYDYRPAQIELSNLYCGHADLTCLPFGDGSIPSLSCMHTVEHIGLGRYGDALDPDGDIKAMRELHRVLANDGNLLFVVPLGRPKLIFNAHRIYSYDQILEAFAGLSLRQFALIPDANFGTHFVLDASKEMADRQSFGCGCFWFRKVAG
ncbi:MAG TPA: DUF268 domain-containing protein [Terriglobales bacterium]|nr:DUF268 domain-containing protein [Terriglobales bacterium]